MLTMERAEIGMDGKPKIWVVMLGVGLVLLIFGGAILPASSQLGNLIVGAGGICLAATAIVSVLSRSKPRDRYDLASLREFEDQEELRQIVEAEEIPDVDHVICVRCGADYHSRFPVCPKCGQRG